MPTAGHNVKSSAFHMIKDMFYHLSIFNLIFKSFAYRALFIELNTAKIVSFSPNFHEKLMIAFWKAFPKSICTFFTRNDGLPNQIIYFETGLLHSVCDNLLLTKSPNKYSLQRYQSKYEEQVMHGFQLLAAKWIALISKKVNLYCNLVGARRESCEVMLESSQQFNHLFVRSFFLLDFFSEGCVQGVIL